MTNQTFLPPTFLNWPKNGSFSHFSAFFPLFPGGAKIHFLPFFPFRAGCPIWGGQNRAIGIASQIGPLELELLISPRGQGTATGRRKNEEPNPNPETRKKPKNRQNRTGKRQEKNRTDLEERVPAEEALCGRERGHEPQGDYQTSGPPGTAEVW